MAHDHPDRGLSELLRRRDEYVRHGVPAEVFAAVREGARRARLAAMRDAAIAAGRGLLGLWRRPIGCMMAQATGRAERKTAAIVGFLGRFWQWAQRRRTRRIVKL